VQFVDLPEPEEVNAAILLMSETQPKLSVVRDASAFATILTTVEEQYLRNNAIKCPWSPLALRLLKELLDRHPAISSDEWRRAVMKHYCEPKAARQMPPVQFIPKLNFYLST
jgi:hypothetical protein